MEKRTQESMDRRLKNLDNELIEIVAHEFEQSIDLVGIHLRDAWNLLAQVSDDNVSDVFARASLLCRQQL